MIIMIIIGLVLCWMLETWPSACWPAMPGLPSPHGRFCAGPQALMKNHKHFLKKIQSGMVYHYACLGNTARADS